jgi:hypothetical protein
VSLLLMIMRAAFAERMIAATKAAARRSMRAGFLLVAAAAAAFFAASLAIVAGVMALSEVLSPLLATAAFAAGFLLLAGVMAAFAGQAVKQVTQPVAIAPKAEAKPGVALSSQTIEVLVACGVAVILGVMAGRANHARAKSSE